MINCSPIRHHSSSKHLISSARDITPGVFRVSVRGEEQHVAEANKDYFEEIGQIQSRKIGQRQQD